MKKTIVLITTLFIHSIAAMEESQLSNRILANDTKKLIAQHYFSDAHLNLDTSKFVDSKTASKEISQYLKHICLIDTAFFAYANDKNIIKIFIRNGSVDLPNSHSFFGSDAKLPGIINYRIQCKALVDLMHSKTFVSPLSENVLRRPEIIAETIQAIRKLVADGADAACRLHNMSTSLHMTVQHNYYEYARQLLEFGSDPNYRFSSMVRSNLKIAIWDANFKMAELLLKFGAHNTELECAVERGNIDIIKLLINHPNMSLEQLEKGIAVARAINNLAIFQLLKDRVFLVIYKMKKTEIVR